MSEHVGQHQSTSHPLTAPEEPRTWHRDGFIVSTDRSLVSIPALMKAFGDDSMYWTTTYPAPVMQTIVDNSLCFTLMNTESQIGFARAITDYVTFFYLTDVYVDAQWQHAGLGTWLIQCVQEFVEGMPYLRRSMLITTKGKAVEVYEKLMKMGPLPEPGVVMQWKGPGAVF